MSGVRLLSTGMKILKTTALALVCFGFAVGLDAAGDALEKPPSGLNAAFIVPLHLRNYLIDVHAIDPRQIDENKIKNGGQIKGLASYVGTAIDVPAAVPDEMKMLFERLLESSKDAEKRVQEGPLLGPEEAFLVLDRERKPLLMIYLHFGIIVARHVQEVAGGDIFQPCGSWVSYGDDPDLIRFLWRTGPKFDFETPFLKWRAISSEGKSKDKK